MKGEPHDRLTRLCDAMTATLEAHPEHGSDVRCVVFLHDAKRGGLQIHGYETETPEEASIEAVADLFLHLKAIFEAQGKTLVFAPLGEG
jgi:hypothetical protein